jgi:hypothetical protein
MICLISGEGVRKEDLTERNVPQAFVSDIARPAHVVRPVIRVTPSSPTDVEREPDGVVWKQLVSLSTDQVAQSSSSKDELPQPSPTHQPSRPAVGTRMRPIGPDPRAGGLPYLERKEGRVEVGKKLGATAEAGVDAGVAARPERATMVDVKMGELRESERR